MTFTNERFDTYYTENKEYKIEKFGERFYLSKKDNTKYYICYNYIASFNTVEKAIKYFNRFENN